MSEESNKRIFGGLVIMMLMGAFTCMVIGAPADAFYRKALAEGKILFQEEKYEKAVDSFRIAEFGLLEDDETLKELYFFYGLSYYKLGRLEEALRVIKKFERNLNIDIKNLRSLEPPADIEEEAEIMIAVFNHPGIEKDGVIDKNTFGRVSSFEILYRNTRRDLRERQLEKAKRGIKKLRKIDEQEPRIHYLQGIYHFKKVNYHGCIKALEKLDLSSLDPLLRDSAHYYLTLSYHLLGNETEGRKFYRKIKDKRLVARADRIIREAKTQPQ